MKTRFTRRFFKLLFLAMAAMLISWQAAEGQIIIIKLYPVINTQPVDRNFCETTTGTYTYFSVSASNVSTYQWQYYTLGFVYVNGQYLLQYYWANFVDGTYVSGSNGSYLYLYEPSGGWSSSSNKTIRVVCSNAYGTATSNTVYLRVHNLPTINTHPASTTAWIGDNVTLSVSASSTYSPSYQWQRWLLDIQTFTFKWSNITGATSSSYTTTSSGSYRVRVTDSYCGSAYSNSATITRVGITGNPSNVSECSDYANDISFTVSASGATAYQWYQNNGSGWTAVSGATSSTYTKTKPGGGWSASDNAQYQCKVSFPIGTVKSGIATLTITEPPAITSQPGSTTKNEGESVTLSLIASGADSYQWQKFVVTDWTDISGETGSAYDIASVTTDDAGNYRCIAMNGCGETTSNTATLSVNPDIGEDGWFAQTSGSSKNLGDASFINANEGWVITDETDLLLHTLTGGDTWTDVYMVDAGDNPIYSYSQSIDFTSSSNGFVTGYNGYSYTTDGGSTWAKKDLKTDLGLSSYFYGRDMFFLDASHGWIVGDDGLIAATVNGGTDWTKVAYAKDVSKLTDAALYEVFFTDLDTGYVAGTSGKIYRTYDGGADKDHWTDVSSPRTNTIQDMYFVTGRKGFAVDGQYNKLLKTVDGGDTWTDITFTLSAAYVYLYAVEFTDASNGWVSGMINEYINGSYESHGVVFRTNDGGETWHRQKMETEINKYIKALASVDADNAWAVGASGIIQRTATGGCMIPTMNLGADQAICEGQSVTLVADTFEQNLNCTYEWQDASTGGTYMASTAGTYSVTATSLCGVTASDEMVLTVNALPGTYAGEDTAICFGDTIQLNASGGLSYQWMVSGKGSAWFSDPNVANPMVTAGVGNTTLRVTATNAEGCSKNDDVLLTVYQVPTALVDAPSTVCRNADADIYYAGNASASANFYWDFDEGMDTQMNTTHYSVVWDTVGTQMITMAVNENGCYSDTARVPVNISPIPISEFTMPGALCDSSYANIVYSGIDSTDAVYTWDFDGGKVITGADEGPYQISWGTEGLKTVSLQVNQDGCESVMTQHQIEISYPYEGSQICLVTVDPETGKNLVIWEKAEDQGIASYNVYRESNVIGVYNLLANVPFNDLSVYTDVTSKPKNQQHLYKITAVDTCGNESSRSPYHKTLLLQYGGSVGGVNLNWSDYEIEDGAINFDSYIIYRGSDSINLAPIDTISASLNAYTDDSPEALAGKRWYRIAGVKPTACYPSVSIGKKAGTGPYTHSLSNLDDNKLKETSVQDMIAGEQNLRVFPNPFRDKVNIEYRLPGSSQVKLEVYNILGVRILEVEHADQLPGSYHYEIGADQLDAGSVYYLRFSVDDRTSVTKLIPAK